MEREIQYQQQKISEEQEKAQKDQWISKKIEKLKQQQNAEELEQRLNGKPIDFMLAEDQRILQLGEFLKDQRVLKQKYRPTPTLCPSTDPRVEAHRCLRQSEQLFERSQRILSKKLHEDKNGH
jgi:hypothetical protein